MSTPDETEDHIRLLQSQNRITHVVSNAGAEAVSSSALVQRCLSAGLEDPVPLPDGSVAIYAPNGLPKALEALNVSVRSVSATPGSGPSARTSDADRLVAIDAAIRELEARINGDLSLARGNAPGTGSAPASETPDETGGAEVPLSAEATEEPLVLDATEADAAEAVPDPEGGDLPDAPMEPTDVPPAQDEIEEVTSAEEETFDAADLPFVPSAGAAEEGDEAPVMAEEAVEMPTDDALLDAAEPEPPLEAPADPMDQDISEVPVGVPEPDPEPSDAAVTPGADPQAMEALKAQMADRADHLAGELKVLAEGLLRQEQSLTDLRAQVDTLAARPAPRPDMTETNKAFARFTTALSHALSRLESVSDQLEGARPGQADTALVDGLATIGKGLSDLAAGGPDRAAPDLGHVIELQEVMVRQMAAILEGRSLGQDRALSEFLADLRHTIAEVVANQERTTLAS